MFKSSTVLVLLILTYSEVRGCGQDFLDADNVGSLQRVTRNTGENRDCSDPSNPILPPTATDTTNRLEALRKEMADSNYEAFIIPTSDQHLSEYPAASEKRREWITGFTGSNGIAVVTKNKAALWTDGRYFLQAEQQLDCNWILMKMDETGVPDIEDWLEMELSAGQNVAASPFLFSIQQWQSYQDHLKVYDLNLYESIPDLIDLVWVIDRPEPSGAEVIVFPIQFAGMEWTNKLANTRTEMETKNIDYVLISILEEVSWFYNIRGGDVSNLPVVTSYALISRSSCNLLYANEEKFAKPEIIAHLNRSDSECVIVRPYDQLRLDLIKLASDATIRFWMPSESTNYGMFSAVNDTQKILDLSPLKVPKSVKNEVEIEAMKKAHIYDAVALCQYFVWLEDNVKLGVVDEINGAEKLKSFRLAQSASKGLSFGSISASGPNGAIIHYKSTPETNRNLTTDDMYLIDSGGQYFEGTTDVTRTLHFGTPTNFERETFTRALMGAIDVQMAIFPYTKDGNYADILARQYLYQLGLEYRHGTGHGIGHYLSVHEFPPGIGTTGADGFPLQPGMFTSVEPGYYEDGSFGLRHENIVVVVEADTKYNFGGYKFYTYEPVTLVPFQSKLIDITLLTDKQLKYLNEYHEKVLKVIGDEADKQGKTALKSWLETATVPLFRSSVFKLQSVAFTQLLCLMVALIV